jgi:putative thioredoxin
MEVKITKDNFYDEVIKKSDKIPVVVDFWAAWCGPCQMLGPILEDLSKKYEGKFVLAKANVDDNPELGRQYQISGIPSVKMFKKGNIVDEFVGALPAEQVEEWLKKNL